MFYDRYTFEADCEQAYNRVVREKKQQIRNEEIVVWGWIDLEDYFMYSYSFRTWEDSREAKSIAEKWRAKASAELDDFKERLDAENQRRQEREERERKAEESRIRKQDVEEYDDDIDWEDLIDDDGHVDIPKGVKTIDPQAFYENEDVVSVTISKGVTRIGVAAFGKCCNLKRVNIPASVTTVDAAAFSDCSMLENIVIPNAVTRIEDAVFANCHNLSSVTIPDSVTSIGQTAFACTGIKSIIIPDSVKIVGENVFFGCSHLKKIYTNNPKLISDSVDDVKILPISAKEYEIDDWKKLIDKDGRAVVPDGVEVVDYHAFFACDELKSIIIPKSVTEIGDQAFLLSKLETIVIPNSVTRIGERAFAFCHDLKNIDIPDSVTEIGEGAFEGCLNLHKIRSNKPELLKGTVYEEVSICPLKDEAKAFDGNWECLIDDNGLAVIPNGVTEIEDESFAGSSKLKSVVIPDSVTVIGQHAFEECRYLENVVIPSSVTEICRDAFLGVGLDKIVIPNSVSKIGSRAFAGSDLVDAIVGAKEIGSGAFSYCDDLKIVVINDSVSTIGSDIFEDCESLEVIYTNKPELLKGQVDESVKILPLKEYENGAGVQDAENENSSASAIDGANEKEEAQETSSIVCPNCGTANASTAKFCIECGMKQPEGKPKCPECGIEVPSGAKFCPECGARINVASPVKETAPQKDTSSK